MSKHLFWRLQGKLAIPTNAKTWAFEVFSNDRLVAHDKIGGVVISTVFIGMDHSRIPDTPPLIFELVVFRGGESAETFRYSTWQQAEAGHAQVLAKIRAEIKERVNE